MVSLTGKEGGQKLSRVATPDYTEQRKEPNKKKHKTKKRLQHVVFPRGPPPQY